MLDATKRLGRRLAGRLHADETLLAAVSVHREGTTQAAMAGGVGGAMAAVSGTSVSFDDDVPAPFFDAGPYLYLALTSHRVLVVRRTAFGRAKDVVFEAPIDDVQAVGLRRGSSRVDLRLSDHRVLTFETPKAPKFLPEVYRRLPGLLAEAKRSAARFTPRPRRAGGG